MQYAGDHIQRPPLPTEVPQVAGLELALFHSPAKQVAGGYYDFLPYQSGNIGLVLGDVRAKGTNGSLLKTNLHVGLQTLVDEPVDCGAAMEGISKALATTESHRYTTLFLCLINAHTGDVSYANAGHYLPFVIRANGEVTLLKGGGPPLAIMPAPGYREERTKMAVGDLLAIYNKGVTDTCNPMDEEFGDRRFVAAIRRHIQLSATEIVNAVDAELSAFRANTPTADDATFIIARRLKHE